MALLDQVLSSVLGGGFGGGGGRPGGGRSPVVNALLLALAAKALQHYLSQRRQAQSGAPERAGTAPDGLGGVLGGILSRGSGSGLGGILGSLGGAGALGGLLEQLNRRGFANQSASWVGADANQPLEAHQVAEALDADDIDELAATTGLAREQVLTEVAQALPDAIDALTPNGRMPTDDELARLAEYYDAEARANP